LSDKFGKLEIAKVNMSTCKEGGDLIVFWNISFLFFQFCDAFKLEIINKKI
jgi:hypothetical protein